MTQNKNPITLAILDSYCYFCRMKKMKTQNIKLSELPETTTADGVKEYGPTSYETQIAILSHYLHSFDGRQDMDARAEQEAWI